MLKGVKVEKALLYFLKNIYVTKRNIFGGLCKLFGSTFFKGGRKDLKIEYNI